MGITRRIIFPALRIVIWAAIAVFLGILAFRSVPRADTDTATPTASIDRPRVEVHTGDITNFVTVRGHVVTDAAKTQRITQPGIVTAIQAQSGDIVEAGSPLIEITRTEAQDPVIWTDRRTGQQRIRERDPIITKTVITATTAGTITAFTALKDQQVEVGDIFAAISPGTLSVTGSIAADQQFRLLKVPTEATITVSGGPAPFTCSALRVKADAPSDADKANGTGAATATLTCTVPPDVTVFPGVAATMEVAGGSAQGALLLPVTAVLGSVETGRVWLVGDDGSTTERAVTLGLNDGENVQILDGLTEGDVVLKYVPSDGIGSGSAKPTPGLSTPPAQQPSRPSDAPTTVEGDAANSAPSPAGNDLTGPGAGPGLGMAAPTGGAAQPPAPETENG